MISPLLCSFLGVNATVSEAIYSAPRAFAILAQLDIVLPVVVTSSTIITLYGALTFFAPEYALSALSRLSYAVSSFCFCELFPCTKSVCIGISVRRDIILQSSFAWSKPYSSMLSLLLGTYVSTHSENPPISVIAEIKARLHSIARNLRRRLLFLCLREYISFLDIPSSNSKTWISVSTPSM